MIDKILEIFGLARKRKLDAAFKYADFLEDYLESLGCAVIVTSSMHYSMFDRPVIARGEEPISLNQCKLNGNPGLISSGRTPLTIDGVYFGGIST